MLQGLIWVSQALDLIKTLSLNRRVNLLGVVGSLLLFYVALSSRPWWTLVGGSSSERAFHVEFSPFAFDAEALGKPLTIPVIPYLNLAARLSMLLAAFTTLAGSLLAFKTWSKPMLSTKGLLLPIIFMAGIFAASQAVKPLLGFGIPVYGESLVKYSFILQGMNVTAEIPLKSEVTVEYWIALAAGVISAFAKIIHGRIPIKAPEAPESGEEWG